MDRELEGILDRADELTRDFRDEIQHCLREMAVSERAKNLFHDVLAKLRSALDIAMSRAWDRYVSSVWQKKKRKIYFPIFEDRQSFLDATKCSGIDKLKTVKKELYDLILRAQPFSTGKTALADFRVLGNLGKHVGLVSHELEPKEAMKVTGPMGTLIYTKGTEFVRGGVIGAPVDSETQRRVPSSDAKHEEIVWVRHILDGYNQDPFTFCLILCQDTRRFVREMAKFL